MNFLRTEPKFTVNIVKIPLVHKMSQVTTPKEYPNSTRKTTKVGKHIW